MAVMNMDFLLRFQVGIEFEFMHPGKKEKIARQMSKDLGVKIELPKVIIGLDMSVPISHNEEFTPTATRWKLEPDYSGGENLCEIITGAMPYQTARLMIIKVFKWIEANGGYTTEKCGIHLNISVMKEHAKEYNTEIYQLDRLKLCLNFDEEFIYKRFPKRRHNVYTRSIKDIVPASGLLSSSMTVDGSISNNYMVANTSNQKYVKYYGINFLKLPKNYLEFRYLGGKHYSRKSQDVLDCLEHICSELHGVLTDQRITPKDRETLYGIVNRYKNTSVAFSNPETFMLKYDKIVITVDLMYNPQIVRAVWDRIKNELFALVVYGNMNKGNVNLDTDLGRIQVKDAKLDNAFGIEGIEFFDCDIEGIFTNVYLYNTKAKNSQFEYCEIVRNSEITGSKIMETDIRHGNTLTDCYVDNIYKPISGHLKNCVIARGKPSKLAKLENCMTPNIKFKRR